jgi:hypothetical protein
MCVEIVMELTNKNSMNSSWSVLFQTYRMRNGGIGSASGTRKESDKCADKFSLQYSQKEPLQRPSDRWMIILRWYKD